MGTKRSGVKMNVTQFLNSRLVNIDINRKKSEVELFYKCFNETNQGLIKKYIYNRKEKKKDSELSKSVRNEGNIFFDKRDYLPAMILYCNSIRLAPYESLEHAVSIANRSAVLFALKRYEDCLVDVNRVLVSKYPKLLMNKIFLRQAKCLLELKRYEAAVEVVNVFKLWLEDEKNNISQDEIDNNLKNINDIKTLIPVNRETLDGGEQISPALSLTDGENPQFAYASKTVAFRKNKRLGRHVVANCNIKKGDILFIEDPYSTSCTSTNSGYYTYCSQCFAGLLTCITCKFCTEIWFCSEQCRKLFWNMRHKWECAAIRKSLLCSEYSLALGILFRTSQTGFNSTVLQKDVYGNKEDNYPYVNQLATHITDMPLNKLSLNIKAAVFLVTYLIHFTDYFNWLSRQDNRPAGPLQELYKNVGGFLLKTLLQIDSNSETVEYSFVHFHNKFSPTFAYHTAAHALYVSSSSMNHSCVPNAVRSFYGSTKVVRASTDILKENEITVSYIQESNMSELESRQRELMQNYYFKCACRLCIKNSDLYAWLCNECQGQALTTSDGNNVKCLDCQCVFTLQSYEEKEKDAISGLCAALCSFPPIGDCLTSNLNKLKRVYFRDSYRFLPWYSMIIDCCDKIGDFRGSVQYTESMYHIQQAVFGESMVLGNLSTFLRLCVSRVNYCLSVNNPTSVNYNKALKEATDSITDCADLLSYYINPKLVDCFKENMLQILLAGTLDYSDTALSFHYNNIPIGDGTKVVVRNTCNKIHFSFTQ